MLRFHIALIEPDVRVCRIRLSKKAHGVAHGRLAVDLVSRTKPNFSCRASSGNLAVPTPGALCLAHSHWRSPPQVVPEGDRVPPPRRAMLDDMLLARFLTCAWLNVAVYLGLVIPHRNAEIVGAL
jgi:hypothetical protein